MNKEWKDRELAKRFVSDLKLPIQIINEELFNYSLITVGGIEAWEALKLLIKNEYENTNEKFLEEYYNVRDKIITTVLDNKAFQEFNTMPMDRYSFSKRDSITSKNIYNQDNIGKTFVSIDLKKANFQVLHKVNKDIVLGADSYEEFIAKFTDLDYIINSKYTRQVIFGKLNPSRHITVEKYYTYCIYELLQESGLTDGWKVVSINNDEIVYEVSFGIYDTKFNIETEKNIKKLIKDELDLIVHLDVFILKGYELCYEDSGSPKFTFYSKVYNETNTLYKLVSVPLPYYLIIAKLYENLPLNEKDYHFSYEGCDCIFNEKFIIKEIVK